MTNFIAFMNTDKTDWKFLFKNQTFKSLDAYDFDCADFKSIEILEWDELKIQDTANKARAGGVDSGNISAITSELQKGYRCTELPPIVMILPNGEKQLWDGYNRYNACYSLGVPDFPFLVYRLKKEWENRIDDAYDIVSLGANNHTVSKRHTINDFVNRGIAYCRRSKNGLTKSQILDWVNRIEHSFNKKQVEKIVTDIYQQTTVAANIIPFPYASNAQSKFREVVGKEKVKDNQILICCKEEDYVVRSYLQMMSNYVESNGKKTGITLYTKGCETVEEVMEQRKIAIDKLKELDELVIRYAGMRILQQESSYEICGFLAQILGKEDPQNLVPLEELKTFFDQAV